MNVKFTYIIAASIVACISFAAYSTIKIEINSIIPSAAISVQKKKLQIKEGMRSPPTRTEYQLDNSYNNTDIIKFYDESLSSHGWTLCHRASGEQYEWVWENHLLKLEGQNQIVHQIFKYIVNAAESEIISIRIYYVVNTTDDYETKTEWNHENRFIDVTSLSGILCL